MKRRTHKSNPAGLDTNTIVLVGLGTALLGTLVYAIYQIGQAQNTLAETNTQIAGATEAAQGISGQIPQATEAAQNVATSVTGATQTAQQAQQSPAAQAVQSLANFWNQL